jgi:hypothetical protein
MFDFLNQLTTVDSITLDKTPYTKHTQTDLLQKQTELWTLAGIWHEMPCLKDHDSRDSSSVIFFTKCFENLKIVNPNQHQWMLQRLLLELHTKDIPCRCEMLCVSRDDE